MPRKVNDELGFQIVGASMHTTTYLEVVRIFSYFLAPPVQKNQPTEDIP